MDDPKVTASPLILKEQMKAALDNPETCAEHRQEILDMSRQLTAKLESSFEARYNIACSPMQLVVARIGLDHGIFRIIAENGDKPTSFADLTEKINLKPMVLELLLDYMATHFMVEEVTEKKYKPTSLTQSFLVKHFAHSSKMMHNIITPSMLGLHARLLQPDSARTAFQFGHNTDLDLYSWLDTEPENAIAFHQSMTGHHVNIPIWLKDYPFDANHGIASTPETILFVDIGGSNGHQCDLLRQQFPTLPGKIILQDRPLTLAKAKAGETIERVSYDYLTPQPIQGARVYYFRWVLHNNTDETCLLILKNQIFAMTSESVIIIDEKFLAEETVSGVADAGKGMTATLSLMMYALCDAEERKKSHWRRLLDEAGLEVKEIHRYTEFGDAVIVAVKK